MADLRISELAALAGVSLAGGDLLPIVDVSAGETKKITVEDAFGYGITLVNDASIPGAKILFTAGTLDGSALVTGTVGTTQLADDGITAAKLANESTVDLVTILPASGAYVGQLALDTDDSKLYCWSGSAWVSFKAAGSINAVVGDTAGIVNLSVTTSGDTVTITTSLDNTGAAAQFLAGPTATGGVVGYRQIASGDLPTASSSGKGGVSVNGSGLTMSGEQIVIDNTVAASGGVFGVVQYNNKGLVTSGRAIASADLPAATASDKGAVIPGTGLAAGVAGALNHSNAVTAGTAAKVTYDAQGHVTAGQALTDADIPSLSAGKITSGTLSANVIGTKSVTGAKLADSSTVQFGGAASTEGVVTFPIPDFKGQQFFDALNGDLYLYDGAAWQPITITAGELIYAGTYNASTNKVKSVTAAGTAAGLVVGNALPAASTSNLRYYVVVSDSGTGTAPAPAVALAPPDMLVSGGSSWELIDVSNAIAGQIASNISFTPTGNIAATHVQAAIQELDDEKLAKVGGTVTGALEIGATGSLVFEGNTADAWETTLTVVDPTADRSISLPDASGTLLTTGSANSVTSSMIVDGTIVDGDINASAAIAGTKVSPNFGSQTIQTTGLFSAASGAAAAPSVTFTGDVDSGFYSAGANQVGVAAGGLASASFIAGGFRLYNSVGTFYHALSGSPSANRSVALPDADVTLTAGTMVPTTGTGASGTWSISITGTASGNLALAGGTLTGAVQSAAGTAGAPGIGVGSATEGLFAPGANALGLASNGVERLRFASTGAIGLSGANYGTSGQVLTSGGSGAAPTWTTVSGGGGDVTLAGANAFTGANTFTNVTGQIFRSSATQDGILLRGRAGGTTSRTVEIIPTTLTASRVLTAPDVSGTIVTTGDTGTVSNTMLATINTAGKVSGLAITSGNISTSGSFATTSTMAVGQASAATNTDFDLAGTFAQTIVAVAALNIDCSTGNYFTKTIAGASTFTVSSVPASRSYSFTLELTHTSGAITWFAGVEWPNATPPTLTTGKTHLFMFVTDDGGTRWRASSLINYTN